MALDLIILTIIVVFLIDLSGVIESLTGVVKKWLGTTKEISLKPLSCSLCMTHHTLFIYLLVVGHLTLLNYLIVCLLAYFTPVIKDLMIMAKDLMIKGIDYLYFLIK